MANPAWSAFDKSIAQSQSLADMLDIINSGRKQSIDKTTGLFRPKPLNEAHNLARKDLEKEFLVEHGGRTFNLAPTAKPVIQLQNGKVVEWPSDMMHRMPEGSRLLNKSAAEIESMLPPMPKPGSAESSVAAEFPRGVAKWGAAGPAAVVGGGATYGALTGQNPMAMIYGAKAPVPDADATPMPVKAEDVLTQGGYSPAKMTTAQMLEAAKNINAGGSETSERPSPWDETGVGAPFNPMDQVANAKRFPSLEDRIIDQVGSSQRFPSMADRAAATVRRGPPADVPARNAAPAGPQPIDSGRSSFFSNLFKDPYAGMSSAKLMSIANRDPDNAAAFFRADEALRRERPEMFPKKEDQGMATGGAAKPSKEAALHKALEIIHSLIGRR